MVKSMDVEKSRELGLTMQFIIQLNLEPHRLKLCRSSYMQIFKNKYCSTTRSMVGLILNAEPWIQRADYKVICGFLTAWGSVPLIPMFFKGQLYIYMLRYTGITSFTSKDIYTLSKDDLKAYSFFSIMNVQAS